jgi:hypothetical protein
MGRNLYILMFCNIFFILVSFAIDKVMPINSLFNYERIQGLQFSSSKVCDDDAKGKLGFGCSYALQLYGNLFAKRGSFAPTIGELALVFY